MASQLAGSRTFQKLRKDVANEDDAMRYEMKRVGTKFSIGWFACLPSEDLDFEVALEYIRKHPYDDFLHKYLLELTGTFGPNLVDLLIKEGKENDPHLLALMYETCILNDKLRATIRSFDGIDVRQLAEYTPLIYINWSLRQKRGDNLYWIRLFSKNIYGHEPLPPREYLERPVPFDPHAVKAWKAGVVPIDDLLIELGRKSVQKRSVPRPTPGETAERAMEKLKACELVVGSETGSQASLSQYALLMPWKLAVSVSTGRNRWQLTGIQTGYGKGLNVQEARASYLMEIVERYSAFASFESESITGYKKSYSVVKATYRALTEQGHDALDPNDMNLEVPYQNQELYWISADRTEGNGHYPIYLPAQLVFLFCNLDEISLTSGLPSNGLAAGNTLEEAKLSALLEVIERDAERIVPYTRDRCFLLESDDHGVKDILNGCAEKGIHVQFLNMTPEFGVPCYKAFIQEPGGEILKGCGAGLDGRRAIVSALTEVPYSDAQEGGSVPAPDGLRTIRYEELPDYSTGDVGEDLKLLERLLIKNGYYPIYVDLTRTDLDIPVVRALVPGLEMITDFDRLSSLSLRQFAHAGYCNGI